MTAEGPEARERQQARRAKLRADGLKARGKPLTGLDPIGMTDDELKQLARDVQAELNRQGG